MHGYQWVSMDIHGYPWITMGHCYCCGGVVTPPRAQPRCYCRGLTPPRADGPTAAAAVVVTYVINFSIGYPGHASSFSIHF